MKNLTRFAALMLSFALLLTMFAGASIKTDLPVVDSEAFTENQQSAAALLMPLGIVAGTGDGELGNGTVTRAQMTAFLYRLVNGGDIGVEKYAKSKRLYSDVDTQEWYAPYINWAYDTKTAYGYTDGRFGPNDPVTGAQAAAMLVRLLGRDASGDDYALKAEAAALELGLDKGIETKGLYENPLSRGDMFILLSRALTVRVKDVSIAEKNFDLEIVSGAILLGVDHIDKVNSKNEYMVFSFRTDTAGDVKYFAADLLCVASDEAEAAEDFGCKFTLLVTKKQDVQGYRHLYAAYEEEQGPYYKIFAGTVDDGKAIFEKDATASKKQNVFYDENCVFYVAGQPSTRKEFEDSFGKLNKARYKLIDNDGDGYYEFAIVNRLTLDDMDLTFVTGKVTAVSANQRITIEGKDGTLYKDLVCGDFFIEKSGFYSSQPTIFQALGIQAAGYMPYAAISNVWYRFGMSDGYLFTVSVTHDTNFHGSYGILVSWAHPMTMYRNMPYALFINENNDYFWSYVDKIDEASAADKWRDTPENSLIYFAETEEETVSINTAGFFNSNYTYRELLASGDLGLSPKGSFDNYIVLDYADAIYTRGEKTDNYSDIARYDSVYAVFSKNVNGTPFWNQADQKYEYIGTDTDAAVLIDRKFNRCLGDPAVPMVNYHEVEGRYVVKVEDACTFYGFAAMEECLFFEYLTTLEVCVGLDIDPSFAPYMDKEQQIYRRNGFWHLRFWFDYPMLTADDITGYALVVGDKSYTIFQSGNYWYVNPMEDGADPGFQSDRYDWLRVAELVKGFNDFSFEGDLRDAIDRKVNSYTGFEARSDYRLLDISAGVVFAYGSVLNSKNTDYYRWVAFDTATFDADFGYGKMGNDIIPSGNTADELIYTVVGGQTYVKALKISDADAVNLPFGWLVAKGFELLVFNEYTGEVSDKGQSVNMLFLAESSVKSNTLYTRINLEQLRIQVGTSVEVYEVKKGEVLMVRISSDGVIEEAYPVGRDFRDYLIYARGLQDAINSVINGD